MSKERGQEPHVLPENALGGCICPHSSDAQSRGRRTGELDTESGRQTL